MILKYSVDVKVFITSSFVIAALLPLKKAIVTVFPRSSPCVVVVVASVDVDHADGGPKIGHRRMLLVQTVLLKMFPISSSFFDASRMTSTTLAGTP